MKEVKLNKWISLIPIVGLLYTAYKCIPHFVHGENCVLDYGGGYWGLLTAMIDGVSVVFAVYFVCLY